MLYAYSRLAVRNAAVDRAAAALPALAATLEPQLAANSLLAVGRAFSKINSPCK